MRFDWPHFQLAFSSKSHDGGGASSPAALLHSMKRLLHPRLSAAGAGRASAGARAVCAAAAAGARSRTMLALDGAALTEERVRELGERRPASHSQAASHQTLRVDHRELEQ
jgi:hypothetical protein